MIDQARNAAIAHEFWRDRVTAMGDAYVVDQVTAREFDEVYQMMRETRKRAFKLTQRLDPDGRDLVRLERQNRDVAAFRAGR